MEMEGFDRLNALSEKAINDTLTPTEVNEFNQLLTLWNKSTEYNLLQGTFTYNFNSTKA